MLRAQHNSSSRTSDTCWAHSTTPNAGLLIHVTCTAQHLMQDCWYMLRVQHNSSSRTADTCWVHSTTPNAGLLIHVKCTTPNAGLPIHVTCPAQQLMQDSWDVATISPLEHYDNCQLSTVSPYCVHYVWQQYTFIHIHPKSTVISLHFHSTVRSNPLFPVPNIFRHSINTNRSSIHVCAVSPLSLIWLR
jgi:hypothetical protein